MAAGQWTNQIQSWVWFTCVTVWCVRAYWRIMNFLYILWFTELVFLPFFAFYELTCVICTSTCIILSCLFLYCSDIYSYFQSGWFCSSFLGMNMKCFQPRVAYLATSHEFLPLIQRSVKPFTYVQSCNVEYRPPAQCLDLDSIGKKRHRNRKLPPNWRVVSRLLFLLWCLYGECKQILKNDFVWCSHKNYYHAICIKTLLFGKLYLYIYMCTWRTCALWHKVLSVEL